MTEFNFLSAWGIELSDASKQEISQQANSLSKKDIEEYIKDSDLRKLKHGTLLPKELTRLSSGTIPPGQYLVQLQKVADITQPTKFQEEFEGGKWRLLALDLSAGDQRFKAIEFDSVKSLGVHLPPGTKLLLYSTSKEPLRVQNGHVLLVPNAVEVLGGYVDGLVANWKADKEVKETRLLWRTDGIKKHAVDGEGAPPWVDFDPKKAPRGTAHRKQFDEERAEWRKGKATLSVETSNNRDDDGPRFQKDAFVEGGAQVKTQVSSNAFVQVESGKGKGKGEGKDRRKGKGDREGWGRGNDYEEEKRAPTQATSSLAAFIKPTKNGELPEAAKALASAPADEWAGEWGESWGDAWAEGWAASGWSGSSYGRSKGGGGGGNRKGKGGGKGGKGKWR